MAGIPRITASASTCRHRLDRSFEWHRYYHGLLGRFEIRDLTGYQAGMNLYEYGADSPLTRIDPSGKGNSPGSRHTP